MDEEKLVAALKARDPAAIEAMIQTHGNRLLRSATLLCGNQTNAEDLVQDTFVQAFQSGHRFRKQSSLHTWLHAILLNLARRHHRDCKKLVYDNELAAQESSTSEEPLHAADFENATAEIDRALRQLSDSHREILVLRYYEHLKINEMAEFLGVSKGTVKSRLHYAIQEMHKLMPAEMNLFGAGGTNKTI